MRRLLATVLVAGCATTSAQKAPTVDGCSLTDETKCVRYGAATAPSVTTPSGQLIIGLADRAAGLPPEEAVDYWRRIVEIMAASDGADAIVNRRAAASHAALASLAVDGVGADAVVIEEVLAESQAAVERVRDLAEFAVRWGQPPIQAKGARAIADAYSRQADVLAAFELPKELTSEGRITLAGKRDGLVRELRAEVVLLHAGLAEHCATHQLVIEACSLGAKPTPAATTRTTDPACGIEIGMPAAAVQRKLGEPRDVVTSQDADCVAHDYSGVTVTLCHDVVRQVRARDEPCPD